MDNVLSCKIVESEFEPQKRNYVHFRTNTIWKGVNNVIPFSGVNQTVPLLSFHINGFGFKQCTEVDMPWNQTTLNFYAEKIEF